MQEPKSRFFRPRSIKEDLQTLRFYADQKQNIGSFKCPCPLPSDMSCGLFLRLPSHSLSIGVCSLFSSLRNSLFENLIAVEKSQMCMEKWLSFELAAWPSYPSEPRILIMAVTIKSNDVLAFEWGCEWSHDTLFLSFAIKEMTLRVQ